MRTHDLSGPGGRALLPGEIGTEIVHDHAGAFCRQRERFGFADSTSGARDDGHLPLETSHGATPLSLSRRAGRARRQAPWRGRHDATGRARLLRRGFLPPAVLTAVLAVLTMASAGCTTAAVPSPDSSTSTATAPGSSTSTTTTTTLPLPVALQGTSVPGDAFLGLVRRVPVVAVPAGRSSAALPAPNTPAYLLIQQVAYRQFGSGPDLLLIMGQDGSMSWWEPSLLSVLAQHYRVTVFDLPGVGYSSPSLQPMTIDWLADETAGLIEDLGLVHAAVLGWGLGGEVALALAERHPASEASLVLVDSSIGGPGAARPSADVRAALDDPAATPTSVAPTLFANDLLSGAGGIRFGGVAVAERARHHRSRRPHPGRPCRRACGAAQRVVQHVPRLERRVGRRPDARRVRRG